MRHPPLQFQVQVLWSKVYFQVFLFLTTQGYIQPWGCVFKQLWHGMKLNTWAMKGQYKKTSMIQSFLRTEDLLQTWGTLLICSGFLDELSVLYFPAFSLIHWSDTLPRWGINLACPCFSPVLMQWLFICLFSWRNGCPQEKRSISSFP